MLFIIYMKGSSMWGRHISCMVLEWVEGKWVKEWEYNREQDKRMRRKNQFGGTHKDQSVLSEKEVFFRGKRTVKKEWQEHVMLWKFVFVVYIHAKKGQNLQWLICYLFGMSVSANNDWWEENFFLFSLFSFPVLTFRRCSMWILVSTPF